MQIGISFPNNHAPGREVISQEEKSSSMTILLKCLIATACFMLVDSSAIAQAGGGYANLYQWNGAAMDDHFGVSVSNAGDLDGDGFADILIGAHRADPSGLVNGGSAYAYSGIDGSLLYVWSAPGAGDLFASSVSAAGDLNGDGFDDVLIGATGTDNGSASSAGAVYAYSGFDGSLLYLWNGVEAGGLFGESIAAAGDVNGDGFDDVIVGAIWVDSPSLTQAGSVYLYSGIDGSLLFQWFGRASGTRFGVSVAGNLDLDQDGVMDVLVGASAAASGLTSAEGAVFAYSGATGALLFQVYGDDGGGGFGTSISNAGDANGDGINDFVVGGPFVDSASVNSSGAAYLFSGATGDKMFEWFGGQYFDYFGWSVAGAGDVNGDGFSDIIVGAKYSDFGGLGNSGSAFAFSGFDGALLQRWNGEARLDEFGVSVSGAGDMNGDGFDEVLVGAWYADPGARFYSGSAYSFTFIPYLTQSASTISVATGGTISMNLDFPSDSSFLAYRVLFSESGTGPTTYGVAIPLTSDALVRDTFRGVYPFATYSSLQGMLDSNGDAAASFQVPGGLSPSLIGRVFYAAAVAIPVGQLPSVSSAPISFTLVP
ncbi:MAG: VCBS repeat-containing protein [Planctomycetota bacterium]